MDARLKHLEFIQAAISRMARCSFAFKGWALTVAAGVSAVGAAVAKPAVIAIVVLTTMLFWGLDAYYLWLERGFINLYEKVAASPDETDFRMRIEKTDAGRRWLATCLRPHLVAFYGTIVLVGFLGVLAAQAGVPKS